MLPGTQQFPRLLPVEEVLKGEAWPPSLHLLPCPSPTAGQGELFPLPASLGSSCLHYLPKGQNWASYTRPRQLRTCPRALKVPVLGGTHREQLAGLGSGYPEMLHSDHEGSGSGSRVQDQEGKVPHML